METYQIVTENQIIKRISDNAFIPVDLNNSDYQRYLEDINNGAFVRPAPVGIFSPFWDEENSKWVETAIVYKNQIVNSKTDVDKITSKLIENLDEQKAKTELLKALATSSAVPAMWTSFVIARDALVAEGDMFISNNNLS